MFETPIIPGAADVVAHFGYWPTFHDAEVLSVTLDCDRGATVAIHCFHMTRDVEPSGHYRLEKHSLVTFHLEGFPVNEFGISETSLAYFRFQNVLSSAEVKRLGEGYQLVLEAAVGLDGVLVCERISVSIEPLPARPEHAKANRTRFPSL